MSRYARATCIGPFGVVGGVDHVVHDGPVRVFLINWVRLNGLIDRAITRGELPASIDREAAADLIAAPVYWRIVVTGGRADRSYVEQLAATLTVALSTC